MFADCRPLFVVNVTLAVLLILVSNLSAQNPATWMQELSKSIGGKKLREVVLPGTHDSATWNLGLRSPVAIDCEINQADPVCDSQSPRVFAAWAKAQSLDMTGQLEAGVRYFDIRVCWHETATGPGLFACHGLLGPSMTTVLRQIGEFLSAHEKEVVILDFQTFYEVSGLHEQLLDELQRWLGNRWVAASPGFGVAQLRDVTMNELWQLGKQAIIIYGEEKTQSECANDEARSGRLEFIEAGRTIRLFDDPGGSRRDDWIEITALRRVKSKVINTFERSFTDGDVRVTYHHVNGLDGKVSRLESTRGEDDVAPLITLYEGNGATQNRVCSISFQDQRTTRLNFGNNNAGRGTFVPYPLASRYPQIWPRDQLIRSEWANTQNVGGLANTISNELPVRVSRFHVIQGQMTGSFKYIAGGLIGFANGLDDFASTSNPVVSDWLKRNWANDRVNVVMVDFIENSSIVQHALSMNRGALTATTPMLDLYEGGSISQDLVCRLAADRPQTIRFQSHNCVNDEARSALLWDMRPGRVIRFYDDPDGKREDDWAELIIKRPITDRRINSFETSFNDSELSLTYHRNNGLNGKISRIEMANQSLGSTVDFYEGVNGSQNLLCSLLGDTDKTVDFQRHPECDNDEAQSMVLTGIPSGRVIKLYDNPGGSTSDDWTEVIVLRRLARKVIPRFDRSFSDADVRVIYHRNNGIQGKVSRATINSRPTGPLAVLYEGGNASQNAVCSIPIRSNRIHDFRTYSPCDNDEARSMALYDVPAGRVVRLYDSPSGSQSDDWVQIRAKRHLTSYVVSSFERNVNNRDVEVLWARNNGLNGKVSRFEADNRDVVAAIPPSVTFKEGNNGGQDTVCTLSARTSGTYNFKRTRACGNDEARSAILNNLPAGTRVQVFDDPGCKTSDDWSTITVNSRTTRYVVPSFQTNFNNSLVRQQFNRKNGLDGKVSCVRITPR